MARFRSLSVIALTLCGPAAAMAAEPPPTRPGAELFAERLTIDQPDLKIRGKVILHSLTPMQAEVVFEEAKGSSERILGLLSRWTTLPPGLAEAVGPGQVTMKQTHLHFATEGVTVKGERIDLPRGRLDGIDFQHTRSDKKWSLSLQRGKLANLPPLQPGLPRLANMTGETLLASGQGLTWHGFAARLQADGIKGEKITTDSDAGKQNWHVKAATADMELVMALATIQADAVQEKEVRSQLAQAGWKSDGGSDPVALKALDLTGPWLVPGRRPTASGTFQLLLPEGWKTVQVDTSGKSRPASKGRKEGVREGK